MPESGSIALSMDNDAVRTLIGQYQAEADRATRDRNDFRKQRDKFRKMLSPMAQELASRYSEGEAQFVPSFTKLAKRFLGLDVDVYLSQRAGRPHLVVTVEGVERRGADQLSESQRYFLDIALRMALVSHIAQPAGVACLYIDTPEGSLDITYEARAGLMFSDFVGEINQLIMTANINTSKLLQSLARACGLDRMAIVRMTEWTSLSDVQAEGEELFDIALAELDTALREGPAGK
ncbi:hypothetical protein MYCSP_04380 [Mycobacteroides saopaulense]|nr:hypothetical protein MYCSP_04380 [Mycobacteroides saopaulense]